MDEATIQVLTEEDCEKVSGGDCRILQNFANAVENATNGVASKVYHFLFG